MEIRIAEHSGFCFGVKRAVAMAVQAAEQGKVYSLGPLMHNPRETERLSSLVAVVNTLDELPDASDGVMSDKVVSDKAMPRVVIRSHGVGPDIYRQAEKRGIEIVDATCPFVAKVQKAAQGLYQDGYQVVIVGDHDHPEVIGIKSWTDDTAWVVTDAAEARALPEAKRIGVVAQTTQTQANFAEVLAVLQARYADVCFRNTICRATQLRQDAAARLALEVELMVVIGGKNSANTKKLLQICEDSGVKAVLIEGAGELSCDMLRNIRRVGICAGASTPDWIIEEVVNFMVDNNVVDNSVNAAEKPVEKQVVKRNFAAEMSFIPGMATKVPTPKAAPAAKAAPAKPAKPGKPVDEMNDTELMEALYDKYSLPDLSRGSHVVGTVVQVKNGELWMDIGSKSLAVLPIDQLINKEADNIHEFKVGDKFEVAVMRGENRDGFTTISKRIVDHDRILHDVMEAAENNGKVSGKIVSVSDKGVIMDVGVTGFIPLSHIDTDFVEDPSSYVGKEMTAKVLRVDKEKNRFYFSTKAAKEEELNARRAALWDSLEEGQIRRGTVVRITSFGAFVDLGGQDALLHRSNISWNPEVTLENAVKVGDEVEVKVLSFDKENGKIAVGMKQMTPDPWQVAAAKYPVGSVIKGTVQKIMGYGAFIDIEPGINGLVHISQVSDRFVKDIHHELTVGQEVEAAVISFEPERRRIGLSIRELAKRISQEAAEESEAVEVAEAAEAAEATGSIEVSDDNVVENVVVEEAVVEEIVAEEAVTEEAAVENVATEDVAAEDVVTEEAATEEAAVEVAESTEVAEQAVAEQE